MASNKDPLIIAETFATQMQEAFGAELYSMMVVGSAARGDYIPGKSDINTLIILTPMGMESLEKAHPVLQKWRGKPIAVPHFMTRESICRSYDSYPLEMLDFKCFHHLLRGFDVFKGITIPPEPMRLQIEREARGKLYLLWQAFAAHAGKDKELTAVLKRSLAAFTAVFQGVLELQKQPIPAERTQVFNEAAKIVGISAEAFQQIYQLRQGKSVSQVKSLFQDLLKEAEKLVAWVDGFKIN